MGNTYRVLGIKKAYLQYDVTGTLTEVEVPFGNAFSIGREFETMDFEGSDDVKSVKYGLKITGTLGYDYFSEDVLERLFAKTAETTVVGEDKRYYFGGEEDLSPNQMGIRLVLKAQVVSDDSEVNLQLTVFKANFEPIEVPEAANRAKWGGHTITWEGVKTTTDISGTALTGVPTNGAVYAISQLTAA